MRKRFAVGVLVLSLVCATAVADASAEPSSSGAPAPVEVGEAPDPEAAHSVRKAFNLDTSEAAQHRAENVVERVGALVTPAEAGRIDRQLEVQERLHETGVEVSSALGTDFAGVWVDRDTDGVEVLTTGDPDLARAAVDAAVPGAPVTVVQVERSDDELRDLAARVNSEAHDELGIVSVGRRPKDNKVLVGVSGEVERAAKELAARYGEGVVVEPASPSFVSRTAGAPWKAGKQIIGTDYSPTAICTGAFGVERDDTYYVTTAGHCHKTLDNPSTWKVGTHTLGTTAEYHWWATNPVTDADVALIEVGDEDSDWVGTNCVYLSATSCATVVAYDDPVVGDIVCYSGARTGYAASTHCYEVSVERDFFFSGILQFDMLEMDTPDGTGPCAGDSGGPIFSPISGGTGVIGRGILSYRFVSGLCQPEGNYGAKLGTTGFSRWSNIQGRIGTTGGCMGTWIEVWNCIGPYSDVTNQHRFDDEIRWAKNAGIANPYSDGTFRPTTTLDRQSASYWLWKYRGAPANYNSNFTDVPPTHPYYAAISWAYQTGRLPAATGCTTGTPCFKPASGVVRQAWAYHLYEEAGSPYDGLPVNQVPKPQGGLCDVPTSHPLYHSIMWNVTQRVLRPLAYWTPPSCYAQKYQPMSTIDRQTAMAGLHNLAN